jgi:hypothetical protein
MTERGLGVRALARHVPCDPAFISRLASGRQQPSAQIGAVVAKIDLALTLAGAGKPDEAAGITLEAVTSPYLVPSNFWRADVVISAVESGDPSGSRELREAITARRALTTKGKDLPGSQQS